MRWSHAVGAPLETKAVPSATKSERLVQEEEEWRETQRACGRESCGTAGGRAVRENAPQKERENGAEKEREERVRRSRARGESSAENRTGRDGPNGRGRIIPPPTRAKSLGGIFWSVVLYARV